MYHNTFQDRFNCMELEELGFLDDVRKDTM